MEPSGEAPLISFVVQPSYGAHRALLQWIPSLEWQMADVQVYRSDTGAAPWVRLTQTAVPKAFAREYLDDDVFSADRLQTIHYRLLLIHPDGRKWESPVVGMLGDLTRREYGHVRRILAEEERRLRLRDGIAMWHFVPLSSGTPNPRVDPRTGQLLSAECPEDDFQSYGLPFLGGYAPPVRTWVQMTSPLQTQNTKETDGMGRAEQAIWQARVLCYPRPSVGHLYVDSRTDQRYVVAGEPQGYAFRGIAFIGFDVKLLLLGRDDPRYRVPLPTITYA